MCIKCYVKLSDFKQFRLKCDESEKVWDQICLQEEEFYPEDVAFMNADDFDDEQKPIVTIKKLKPTKVRKKRPRVKKVVKVQKVEIEKDQLTEEDARLKQFYNFFCPTCEPRQKFDSLGDYKAHMKVRHNEKSSAIICCNKKMTKRHELFDHMLFHSEPERLSCQFCEKLYSDRKNLNAHLKRKHGTEDDKKWQCDVCKKRFMEYEPMKMHLMTHLSAETRESLKTHLCNECGQTFLHKNVLQSHIKYVHLKQGFICDICGNHFKSRFDYELHRRNAHGEEGPSREQCPICQNWYSNEKAVREHIRYLHERTEKIRCKICREELSSKPSLRSHMKMKHEEKLHRCNFCEKALPTAIRLKEHEAMHTGISLYNCMYCPKVSTFSPLINFSLKYV